MATKWPCHHRIIILSAVDKLTMTTGLKAMLVQTAGYVNWKIQHSEMLWASVFQDFDLLWSPILIPKFFYLSWLGLTNQGETTWLAVTLPWSPAISQTSQACQPVFHWMRPIAFVIYALRPFFNHLMYFVLPESACVLVSFEAFGGYFIFLIFLLPPSPSTTFLCGPCLTNTVLLHSFHSLATVLGTKQHFTFQINSVCVFLMFMAVMSVPLHHK